jgi:hypothetical protein
LKYRQRLLIKQSDMVLFEKIFRMIKKAIEESLVQIKLAQIQNWENQQEKSLHWASQKGKIELLSDISNKVLDRSSDIELLEDVENTKQIILNDK